MPDYHDEYRRTVYAIIVMLLAIVGWFAQNTYGTMGKAIENNTIAMNKFSEAVVNISNQVNTHEVRLAEHDIRLQVCEKIK